MLGLVPPALNESMTRVQKPYLMSLFQVFQGGKVFKGVHRLAQPLRSGTLS